MIAENRQRNKASCKAVVTAARALLAPSVPFSVISIHRDSCVSAFEHDHTGREEDGEDQHEHAQTALGHHRVKDGRGAVDADAVADEIGDLSTAEQRDTDREESAI